MEVSNDGWISFGAKRRQNLGLPTPSDGRTWSHDATRSIVNAITLAEGDGETIIYSKELETLLYMIGALVLRTGLPVSTRWRCTKSTHKGTYILFAWS